MLATPGELPPDGAAWGYEVKWDGVRALAFLDGGATRLAARTGRDITPRYPELAGLAHAAGGRTPAVLDGEVVAFDETGRPSFGELQKRMHLADPWEVRRRMSDVPVALVVFDVLWIDGRSAMALPYAERRGLLQGLDLTADDACWTVPAMHSGPGTGEGLLDASRRQGLEGVVAKKLDSAYEAGRRSRCWLKVKNLLEQEFVVGGWVPGGGNRSGRVGALLVGYHDATGLRYAGRVGTGFSDKELSRVGRLLDGLARPTSPFVDPIPERTARFAEPAMVVSVAFSEWTHLDTLRHPRYRGERDDKAPGEVVRET